MQFTEWIKHSYNVRNVSIHMYSSTVWQERDAEPKDMKKLTK